MRGIKFAAAALFALAACLTLAQDTLAPIAPPDFQREAIRAVAEETANSWAAWQRATRGLEERVFKLPMAEAHVMAQKALGQYLDYLDKRRDYGQAVAGYMEILRVDPRARGAAVTQAAVFEDHVQLLGVNLSAVQARLNSMRNSAEWPRIRRDVQPAGDAILKLQDDRRSHIPIELPSKNPAPPPLMSYIIYRDAERQVAEALQKLWTQYYQALADAAEQRTSGSLPLVAIRTGAPAEPAAPDAAASQSRDPLVGAWNYMEGSQQFNGVAEPKQVLLEIWTENGQIVGRYRALLSDFSGDRQIDLRLRADATAPRDPLTLEFQSKDPAATGKITLEGPKPGSAELMLVRTTDAQSPIPRGRELLHRRQ